MRNLNRVTMIGQLTADPEHKTLPSGQNMTTFGLATNYAWKDKEGEWKSGVDYHRVVSWQGLAEKVAKDFKKGEKAFIEGKLRTRSWEAEDGTKKFTTEIVANNVLSMSAATALKKTEEITEPQVEEVWEREKHEVAAPAS
ncbi:single-stranded DNA-binding protein [Patescibacteria group bacterium]